MQIHFLGTSSGCPSLSRNVAATAVEFEHTKTWLLVDCGEGTQHQIMKSPLAAYHLGVILITHLHGDHCYGLPGLLASISMAGRKEPVHLVAPKKVIEFVEATLELTEMETAFSLIFTAWETLDNQQVLEFSSCLVTIHPLQHRVPCVGFKIIEKGVPNKLRIDELNAAGIGSGPHYNQLQRGQDVIYNHQLLKSADFTYPSWQPRKVLICGDNEKPSLLASVCQDVDLLVHEATFTSADLLRVGEHTGHSDAKRVAQFAEQCKIPKLALIHFSSRYHGPGMLEPLAQEAQQYYHGQLILAEDGLTLSISKHLNLNFI
ncbi:ribonuclease Z [Pseudoalteromonas tunicata]|jgi:ribonuclease Z|uniref:Ribonuclease Z n=1 Tax=Pseudoalteromonas tunicata D2 TaxID=87626 RepID=A4C3A0_9GAMM|nr:ribonuclease Z [Pseudoalteromonas tunicata]ATC96686.1 ribonuclease Z [Pseudoalteromonas tunicata]AXT32857.1 ribonuclease Z [Pseudoalteromonas tunicata]EAR30032.1 metallo-beta-lactamase family protein [Pseudoalteromonas tunicata D2]